MVVCLVLGEKPQALPYEEQYVRYNNRILLKIAENICSRMLQDSLWIKWIEF